MKDQMLISAEAIKAQMATAGGYVKSVNHVPVYATAIGAEGSADAAPSAQTGRYSRYRRPTRSTVPGLSTMSSSASASSGGKLIETVMGTEDDDLMSPMQATCLNAIRTAVATALAVGDEVMKAQNADHLKAKNKSSALGAKDMEALKAALEIEAIATLTTFGNALQFYLSTLDGDATIETGEVKEIITDNGRNALAGAIWELNDKIKAHHKKGKSIVCVLLSYCEDLLTRMESRFHAHPGIEAFTANAWAVEGESLVISGFEPAHRGKKSSIEMKRVAPEDVVGNAIAKAQCERLARMMTCYDFTAKKNPFAELGGYVFTFMGDGNPGTGKTTLIQMMGTMLGDICEMAGYPFLYENEDTTHTALLILSGDTRTRMF
mgnify:FL=1